MRYITVFPECEAIHLKKDVGMLPYALGKYCGYDYSIICYDNFNFCEADKDKFHVKVITERFGDIIDFAIYIYVHAKEIDILNLYHITSRRNIFWILAYKIANPHGIVHMKLDADYRMVNLFNTKPKNLKERLKWKVLNNKVDLYTVESTTMKSVLEEKWNLKIKIIPNGIYREGDIALPKVEEKNKIFLTVGRLGTEQKATETLLSAFEMIKDDTDWQLILAGTIEKDFQKYIQQYFKKNPDLKNRVLFTGNISNSEELTRLYKKASIFVLPSKWEGFALVLIEALECGDYLIVSYQVPTANDIGNAGKYSNVVQFGNETLLA